MKKLSLLILLTFLSSLSFSSSSSATEGGISPEVNRGHLPKLLYRAIRLTDSKISEAKPESYDWDWTGAVMMVGIDQMYEQTKQPRYLDYMKRWLDHHIKLGYTVSRNDQIAPALLLLKLYKATGDPIYLDHAKRMGDYITDKAPRTTEGGLLHYGAIGSKSMWIDSLFMVGPFLVELAEVTGDKRYYDEAVKQSLIMYSHLQDPGSGLCGHKWDETSGKATSAHWLRGNSWALASTAIVLSALPSDFDPASRARLLGYYRKHAQGLVRHQDDSGLWHTVIDGRESYLESSGSALVAFGLIRGVSSNLLEADYLAYAQRALFGLMDYVTIHPDGFTTMFGISLGTRPGTENYYSQVTVAENVPYGVGAFDMAVRAYCVHTGYKYDASTMRVEDGWEALRWGRIDEAEKAWKDAVAANAESSAANFLAGFVILGQTVSRMVDTFSDMSVEAKGVTPIELQRRVVEEFAPAFALAGGKFEVAENDPDFTQVIEQTMFMGGTSSGYMQLDRAETALLEAIAKFAEAACYFMGSYNIDGPPFLLARKEFGRIVKNPAYPNFLTLNGKSKELLPKSREALAANFAKIKAMVGYLKERKVNYPGCIITLDTLRLRGEFGIPGIIERQSVTKYISKSRLIGCVLKYVGRDTPEKLPRWMDSARESVINGRILNMPTKIKLNLAAPYENPQNLRELFPVARQNGVMEYPDPTLGGLLPGMTNERLVKMLKPSISGK